MEKYFWLAGGLVIGAFFPNQIRPRAVALWRAVKSAWHRMREED